MEKESTVLRAGLRADTPLSGPTFKKRGVSNIQMMSIIHLSTFILSHNDTPQFRGATAESRSVVARGFITGRMDNRGKRMETGMIILQRFFDFFLFF